MGCKSNLATNNSSGFFESDGLQIYYEIFGLGNPLILVHEKFDRAENFVKVCTSEEFCEKYLSSEGFND